MSRQCGFQTDVQLTGIGSAFLSFRAMAFFTSWSDAVPATYSIRSKLRSHSGQKFRKHAPELDADVQESTKGD